MNAEGLVYANPLDLPYRYQHLIGLGSRQRSVHREAADPSVILFQGRYFMFASMSNGFFYSDDLVDWQFQATDKLPALDYAPDVCEIDGALYLSASRRKVHCPIFRSLDPLADDFTQVSPGSFAFWDPGLFADNDGRRYLYWGCSNRQPIMAAELGPDWSRLTPPVNLFDSDIANHGWERPGENNQLAKLNSLGSVLMRLILGKKPFMEGSWMNRRGDTYYLQYAAPGTEYNSYADGYYTAVSPLGPFTYSPMSPFSSKPGGFITGAGHGSTFADEHGNWWHAATMRISVHHSFERRVGLFPAGFDADGDLFCNQELADYPLRVPPGRFDPWQVEVVGMLLSYHKPALVSSAAEGTSGADALDENVRTWWAAASAEPGQWLSVDLGAGRTISAIQVNLADHDTAAFAPALPLTKLDGAQRAIDPEWRPTEFTVEVSADGETWQTVADTRGKGLDSPHHLVVLDEPVLASQVRLTGYQQPYGARLAVSGLRVFGSADVPAPDPATPRAELVSPLDAHVSWEPIPGAIGYDVRYGLAPDKLYHSWLVYDQTSLTLSTLNAGQTYWVAVDALGEGGLTRGSAVQVQPLKETR